MQELKNAPGIVELNLHFAEYVTDEGMAAIKGWKKLKRLNVRGAKSAMPRSNTSPASRLSNLSMSAPPW